MVSLVVNASARSGSDPDAATLALEAAGLDVETHPVEAERVRPLLRELVQDELVVVGGGDGTINLAAQELAHTDALLGILPMGTQNSFARSLGIPLELEDAAQTIATGRSRSVDLGQVGDRIFTHSVTIGISTDVAQETHATFKRVAGQVAYVLMGSKALATHEAFRYRFVADGAPRTLDTHQLVISNGGLLGPAELSPEARPDDRRLHVAAIGSASRWEFVRGWAASLVHRPKLPVGSVRFEAKELDLETDPIQQVDVDGEPGMRTPINLQVLPGALRVVTP